MTTSTTHAATSANAAVTGETQHTACILCSLNCGIQLQAEDGHLRSIRGDKAHPVSAGYQCQKALRLDYYQNGFERLRQPLKKQADGTFKPISWSTAIREIAERLVQIRDTHGGETLAYYGGGGQGNHLGGIYGTALRAAMGTRYLYSSLAQEKTGGFWLNGKLFGRQTCHVAEDVHHSDYVVFIGTNPWQSHGIPQARKVINEIAKDPNRTMVVVDPRVTETARKADIHLQVQPGGDAHLMMAMLGILVQEDLVDQAFLAERTVGYKELESLFRAVPVEEYCRQAGVDVEQVRQVTRGLAGAKAGCVRTDLGLEHTLHSTLNCYLSKLLFLFTGHFGKKGGNNLHNFLMPLIGHSEDPDQGGWKTQVTGMREISKLYPPNVLPAEIDNDHPKRTRGLVVDSGNPLVTAADTQAYRRAFKKLDLLVVIDVAMTETARLADYILPASSQFEKCEATFFNVEFPANFFHLRHPVLEPLEGTLTEPEIYRRLVVAMGEFPHRLPLLQQVAKWDRRWPKLGLYSKALAATLALRPKLKPYMAMVLYETLGAALEEGTKSAAVLWGACQYFVRRHSKAVGRVGIQDEGAGLGEALFQRILTSKSGTLISVHEYEETWNFLRHPDHKIHLVIQEMLDEISALEDLRGDSDFDLVLMAGERRSYNANTIIRDEDWRKKDSDGALKIHPEDARSLEIEDGSWAVCESSRGSIKVRVGVSEEMLPGVLSLPHGFGLEHRPSEGEGLNPKGPAINHLTDARHCDELAKTPFHKHIPVRVRPWAKSKAQDEAVLAEV